MKILITTDWYEPVINGVVTSVMNLSRELRMRGHEVKILTLARGRHTYIDGDVIYAASMGVGRIYPEARLKLPVVKRVVDRLIEWHPDVIHSQCEFSTFFMARQIAEDTGAPIIHTYHTVYEDYTHYFSPNAAWGRKLVRRFTRMVANRVDVMIAPSGKIREVLEGYRVSCPIEVVPSGIDVESIARHVGDGSRCELRKMYGISDDDRVLLYVGRLAKEKNIEELIRMVHRMDDTYLVIVGGGPHGGALRELVSELGVSDRVVFTGMVSPSEVSRYYQIGDAFVSASTSETQGLTYIEALAAGLPLVCRQDECLSGVVTDGVNGWMYTDEDTFDEAVRELFDLSGSERRAFRENSFKAAWSFSTKAFAEKLEKIYDCRVCGQEQISYDRVPSA